MNPFAAAKGDKLAMRPFAKLLWTVVKYYWGRVAWSLVNWPIFHHRYWL